VSAISSPCHVCLHLILSCATSGKVTKMAPDKVLSHCTARFPPFVLQELNVGHMVWPAARDTLSDMIAQSREIASRHEQLALLVQQLQQVVVMVLDAWQLLVKAMASDAALLLPIPAQWLGLLDACKPYGGQVGQERQGGFRGGDAPAQVLVVASLGC